MNPVSQSRWLPHLAVFASVLAAVFGLAHGLSPSPGLVERLRDDAFYEFTWAANLAAGHGPSVSDGTWTSGVQLLWSLCLVPFVWIAGPGSLPLVAPWLGLVCHFGASLLWLFRGTDRVAALCVSLCWLGNPLLVRECQNGQETALACFLLVWLWHARHAPGRRFWGIAGLCVLARTDLFAMVVALSVWRHRERPWRGLRLPAVLLGMMVVLYRLLGGGWLPDSAAPMAWLWHANFAATDPSLAQTWARTWWYLRPVLLGGPFAIASAMGVGLATFSLVRPWWPTALRAVPALAVGCASALGARDLATPGWAALLIALLPVDRRHGVSRSLLALFLGSMAIIALHWAVRWYPRDYYAAPLVVLATVAVLRLAQLRLVLVVLALAQLADFRRLQPEPLRGQQEMEMGGRFLAEVLPSGERVGCFNSGIVTFDAAVLARGTERERRVVNLDGVVDARALRALQGAQLGAWLDAQGVRFLLDNPVQFARDASLPHACGHWFGEGFDAERDLVEVARFDVPFVDNGRPGGDSFRLYWRRGRGAPPPPPPSAARDLGSGPDGGRYVLWPAGAGQWLEGEVAPGLHTPLVQVDVATTVILFVSATDLGTGRLFVRGNDRPVLILPKL
jgi:hypothetical protein